MVLCCVPNCFSGRRNRTEKEKISFHEIPSKKETRDQWITFISNLCEDNKPWTPHENGRTCLCNKHFREEDFVTGAKYRVLKRGAVPSMFECDLGTTSLFPRPSTDVRQADADVNDPMVYFQHPTSTTSRIVLFDYLETSVIPELLTTDDANLSSRCRMPDTLPETAPDSSHIVAASASNLLLTAEVAGTPDAVGLRQSGTIMNAGLDIDVDAGINDLMHSAPRTVVPLLKKSPKPTSTSVKCQRVTVKDHKKIYHNPLDAIRILRQRIASKRAQICRLRRTVHTLEEANSRKGGRGSRNDENRDAQKLRVAAEAGDPSAIFLLDLVRARHMKHSRCSEVTVRYCKLLRARYPAAYEFIRKSGLLRFPSRQTLSRYPTGVDQSVNNVAEEPLIEQEVLLDDLCQPSEIILDN